MKKIFTIAAALMITSSVWAQSPEKMSYQAVVRNSSDALVTSTAIGMKISILEDSATGNAVYTETHTSTTNANGLVSLEIGTGTSLDDFTSIDWGAGPYFIKTEIDPTGGSSYTITGTSQLMSVPYALHAKTADSIVGGGSFTEVDGSVTNEIQDLQLVGNNLTITDNGSATSIDLSAYLDNTDTQLDSAGIASLGYVAGANTNSGTNEVQDLQLVGNNLTITDNGSATSIDLSAYLDNTDTQLDSAGIASLGYVAGANGSCGLSIGDTYQGGIIFYLDASGCHGLISAVKGSSEPKYYWANAKDRRILSLGSCVGCGFENTELTVYKNDTEFLNAADTSYAAVFSKNYVSDGYDDWYLPSLYELKLMHSNIGLGNALGLGNIGDFIANIYWSSTVISNPFLAYSVSFQNDLGTIETQPMTNKFRTRAVRAF